MRPPIRRVVSWPIANAMTDRFHSDSLIQSLFTYWRVQSTEKKTQNEQTNLLQVCNLRFFEYVTIVNISFHISFTFGFVSTFHYPKQKFVHV